MQCKSMKHCVTQPTVFIDLRNVGSWGAWNTSGGIVLNKTICFFGSRWSLVMLLQSLDLKTLLYMDSFHHKCILQSDDETCLRNWIYYKCIKCLSSSNRPHAASLIGDDERLKKDKREVGRRKKKEEAVPESAEPVEGRYFWPWQAPLISGPKRIPQRKLIPALWIIDKHKVADSDSLSLFLSLFLFFVERDQHTQTSWIQGLQFHPSSSPYFHCDPAFLCSYSKVRTEELRPAFRPWETTTFMHKYCKADHSVEKEPLRISRISNPALPDRKKTRETIANSFIRQRLLTLYPQATFTWRPVPVIWFKAQTE